MNTNSQSQSQSNYQESKERPRRAFRDVTNASSNVNGKEKSKDGQPLTKKRHVPVVIKRELSSRQAPSEEVKLEAQMQNNLSISQNRGEVVQTNRRDDANANDNDYRNVNHNANHNSYQFTGQLDDIDKRDADDPLCATDYVQDMYENFRMKEDQTSVKPVYMERQTHINEKMRSILIDWLIEVHLKFKLIPETLYLTVNVIDRYLDKQIVSRQKLQLLGVTALFLASKYEEIYPPEIGDLIYICDRAYKKNQIIAMEEKILNVLSYNMTVPSAHVFLVRFLKAAHADRKIVQLSCYILDGTLASYTLLHYKPSQLAAAAVMIARKVVGRNAWSPTLRHYACYDEQDILPVARALVAEKSSSNFNASGLEKKYSSSKYGGIARTPIEVDL